MLRGTLGVRSREVAFFKEHAKDVGGGRPGHPLHSQDAVGNPQGNMSISILSKLHPAVTWHQPGVPDSL